MKCRHLAMTIACIRMKITAFDVRPPEPMSRLLVSIILSTFESEGGSQSSILICLGNIVDYQLIMVNYDLLIKQSILNILVFEPNYKLTTVPLQMNLLSNMEEIAEIIIRPNRYIYKPVDLGPKLITLDGQSVYHHDFEIKNSRGLILKASLYTSTEDIQNIKSIIIYLHCNSGCRIEGLAYMKMAVTNNFSYVVFDFAGSGISQGKYVSLGFFEVDDIKSLIKHLKKRISSNVKIVLWGRSMGAVAALRYLATFTNDTSIIVSVFDSPFHSLKELFIEIGRQKTNLPKIVLEVALKYLKPIIQSKASFNIDDVNLEGLENIQNCPGIFIASKNDSLIPFSQMDTIFKDYKSPKQMLFVEQSHNEPRNINVIKDVFRTMKKYFDDSLQSQLQYRSQLPSKDPSRKKLELTIKSYSQKNILLANKACETPKKCLKEISFPHLEKKPISCVFEKNRKQSKNILVEDIVLDGKNLSSSEIFKTKKNPITVKRFFKDENVDLQKQNVIKFKSQREGLLSQNGRDQERKTMQHIANKKPPLIENQKLREFRSSMEARYRSQFKK